MRDWLDTPHARGWLQPSDAGNRLGNDAVEAALHAAAGQGFVAADAAVLARTPTGAALPLLSWDHEPPPLAAPVATGARSLGLYAIADSAARLRQIVEAGARTVQLRIKTPASPDAAWHAALRGEIAQAIGICDAAGAELYVNDHWRLAHELGARGVHLGQEDLLAMDASEREALRASGLALGVSSHSAWELCRARALGPRYIACGPVWPTITKDMPWIPQGLDNLAWWCRMAQAPVVAIGGILGPEQVRQVAATGCDSVCIVRGLGVDPGAVLPGLRAAFDAGRADARPLAADWPHPSLPVAEGDPAHA
ncbi:MAG: thiamine phosphate synthase [Comamonadaceae bacterium]|nr:MAG: thiamine phosphate synthase [Comamonadaceae bacterium]